MFDSVKSAGSAVADQVGKVIWLHHSRQRLRESSVYCHNNSCRLEAWL
jgi:hypothetical protein